MKVKVIRGVIANGEHNAVGAVIEVSKGDGIQLVASGKAVAYVAKPKPKANKPKGEGNKQSSKKANK